MLSAQGLFGLISWILPLRRGWYHETLRGTSLLIHVFIHILGMTRISPIFAATADAPEASSVASDVQTDVIGDGLEDERGEGASTSAVVDNDVTPSSSWSPPADMVSTFDCLVGIDTDTWGETKRLRLSTTSVVRCWTTPDSGFHPFRRYPSLHVPFEKFAKDKRFYNFAISTMGSSYAAAHSLMHAAAHSLMHAAAFVEEFLQHLPTVLEGPNWAKWCVNTTSSFQANVLLPLKDSARCSSGSIGSSVMVVRTGVVKCGGGDTTSSPDFSALCWILFWRSSHSSFGLQLRHDVVVDQGKASRCITVRQASCCCIHFLICISFY